MSDLFHTPVLFMVFNRLETAEKVFAQIKKQRPSRLFIAADGPRANKAGEYEKCLQVRSLAQQVDWPCDLQLLYREENLGCKRAVAGAISWFFSHVESGIILEDDCLPGVDFFPFCAELLEKYKDDASIFSISGSNIVGAQVADADYFFSRLGGIWGWASWRRAWENYTLDIRDRFNNEEWEGIATRLANKRLARALRSTMKASVIDKEATTWDYQWVFTILRCGGMSIIPNKNLISNIGFIEDSTHTADVNNPLAELPVHSLQFPLKHPERIEICRAFDDAYERFFGTTWWRSLREWMKKVIHG